MAKNVKPRVRTPKKAKKGDVVEIKTLISHKMETGQRKDKKRENHSPQHHQQTRSHL